MGQGGGGVRQERKRDGRGRSETGKRKGWDREGELVREEKESDETASRQGGMRVMEQNIQEHTEKEEMNGFFKPH